MTDATQDVRLAIGVVMLVGASWSDLRTRRVANMYWMPFLAAAGVFVLGDIFAVYGQGGGQVRSRQDLVWAYSIALFLCAFFYALWRLHLFGGADAKGLMVLALLLPWAQESRLPLPTALDALANASLLMLGLPLIYATWNLISGHRVFPAMFLGRRLPMEQAELQHVWPLQRVGPAGGLAWRYLHRPGEDLGGTYQALRAAGVAKVWVTPKIPFMVPLAVGLAVTWLHGNILVRLLLSFAR